MVDFILATWKFLHKCSIQPPISGPDEVVVLSVGLLSSIYRKKRSAPAFLRGEGERMNSRTSTVAHRLTSLKQRNNKNPGPTPTLV
jgi:hypothetical protein